MTKKIKRKEILPLILVILDGWGIATPNKGNPVVLAKTPTMDGIIKKYPNTLLCAHGVCAGLPSNQVGNSEAGHMNIGAGRRVEQDTVKISKSIKNGTFFKNTAFIEAIRHVKNNKSNLHIMGMLSDGMSPHSDPEHLKALIKLAKQEKIKNIYLHLFTDGRDSPQYASLKLVQEFNKKLKNGGKIATIMGRFYAMDRKKKWERTEMAYNALVLGKGRQAKSATEAITESYNSGNTDEFIEPYVITEKKKPLPRIRDNDSVIFFNLRSDRARQLAKVFVQKSFNKLNRYSFKRKRQIKNLIFVAMTDFGPDLDSILTAFPSVDLKNTLPMVLSGMKQLYITESEKRAHMTYFFNGGYSGKVDKEAIISLPSPDVKSYDKTPSMRANDLTEIILVNLKNKKNLKYEFTALNFSAPDMVGHTGNLKAAIECCHEIDKYLGKIIKAYLKYGGTVIVTADHGNVEEMINLKTGEIDTEHSTNPVPFVLVNKKMRKAKLRRNGKLYDIAPTILDILDIKKPKEMAGKSLIK